MPATTATKTLSPAELAKLEHAFASDPASDAYRALAEAYLGMGRFMEAMVVCKKGVKAHPSLPDPRLLLARVYAEQGKDKKALEEAVGALQVAPSDKVALRMAGALQIKTGEAEAGKANLLKAFEADPGDQDTLAVMKQHNVEPPKKEPPPPPPPPPQPVQVAPVPTNGAQAAAQSVAAQAGGQSVQVAAPGQPVVQQAQLARPPAVPAQPGAQRQAARPAQRPPAQAQRMYEDEEPSEVSEVSARPRRQQTGLAKTLFFAGIFLVPVVVGGYYGIGTWRAKKKREVNKLLRLTTEQLEKDSYGGYQEACKLAEQALDNDPSSPQAHAYAAYAYAIRSGEHGGGENDRKSAEEHLKEALESSDPLSQAIAADALLKFYSGKRKEAVKELDDKLKQVDPEGNKASLLWLTLGMIQTETGDLEGARDSLEKAQRISSTDARIYAALGNLSRRRGDDATALRHFTNALNYQKAHPDSKLGTALLILDQADPGGGYGTAAKNLKELLEADPPISPRQDAMALMGRALLFSRVSRDLPLYVDAEFKKKLEADTGVGADSGKAKQEIAKAEDGAFSKDKANPELHLLKGKRLAYEDNIPGATEEIRKAIAVDATRAHFHVELGKVLLRKEGNEREAEEALTKALTYVPDSPKLLTLLGQAQLRQKKVDEAIKTYETAIKNGQRNGEARFALGRIYRNEKGDLAKAVEHFEKAAKDYSGNTMMVATSYNEAALTYEKKGDAAKARDNYEKANNADRDYEPAACSYARFLVRGGDAKDKEKVKELAKRYMELTGGRGECAGDLRGLAQ